MFDDIQLAIRTLIYLFAAALAGDDRAYGSPVTIGPSKYFLGPAIFAAAQSDSTIKVLPPNPCLGLTRPACEKLPQCLWTFRRNTDSAEKPFVGSCRRR